METIAAFVVILAACISAYITYRYSRFTPVSQAVQPVSPPDPTPSPSVQPTVPVPVPESEPAPEPPQQPDPDSYLFAWDTPKHNWHNVRVLCDRAGLTVDDKNLICAVVYQESQFYNYEPDGQPVKFENKDDTGRVWSTDWGIAQINDLPNNGHICINGCDFPSVEYVLANPDAAIRYLITMFKAGKLDLWSSYKYGAYKKWLSSTSAMWALA